MTQGCYKQLDSSLTVLTVNARKVLQGIKCESFILQVNPLLRTLNTSSVGSSPTGGIGVHMDPNFRRSNEFRRVSWPS